MEAMAVAFWLDRIAFFLVLCIILGANNVVWMPVITTLLAISSFIYLISYFEHYQNPDQEKFKNSHHLRKTNNANYSGSNNSFNKLNMEKIDEESNREKENKNEITEATIISINKLWDQVLEKAYNNEEETILLHKARDKCNKELEKFKAVHDEEVRKVKENCEEDFKNKMKNMEEKFKKEKEKLNDRYNEELQKWQEERSLLKQKYEEMRWK